MKEFGNKLSTTNKNNFQKIIYERWKCYLRRDLYEHILSREESDYFSLDNFNQRVNNMETVVKMVKEVIPELEALGWKCLLSFGETGLFVYSDKKPENCWEEESLS